jgi:hypothetical protein
MRRSQGILEEIAEILEAIAEISEAIAEIFEGSLLLRSIIPRRTQTKATQYNRNEFL